MWRFFIGPVGGIQGDGTQLSNTIMNKIMPNLKIMITNYRMVCYLQKLLLIGYSIILDEDIFL